MPWPKGSSADPAFVSGFAGKLVARIGGETDAVFRAFVIDCAVERKHTKDEQIARLELRGKPASAVPLLRLIRILRQPTAAVGILILVLVHVDLAVSLLQFMPLVGALQDRQRAVAERHLALRNPRGHELRRPASHVDPIRSGSRWPRPRLTVPHPDVIEMQHLITKKLLEEGHYPTGEADLL